MRNVVIITGASRGLGFRIAEAFAAESFSLLIISRDKKRLSEAYSNLTKSYPDCEIESFQLDLANRESVETGAFEILKHCESIAGLINNAGIIPYRPFTENTADDIINTLNVNLTHTVLLTRLLLPRMLENGGGRIINIASDLSKRPWENMVPYVASKYGLLGFSRALSKEFRKHNIHVSCISPGMINSRENKDENIDIHMLPTERLANVVLFIYKNSDIMNFDDVEVHPSLQEF